MSSAISGYNAVFFGREDHQLAQQQKANHSVEVVWAPSPTLGMSAATLAGWIDGYGAPGGFDMAEWSSDAPVMDDATLEDYNVGQIVDNFVSAVMGKLGTMRGTDVMFTMGSDFNYENAATWFTNMVRVRGVSF